MFFFKTLSAAVAFGPRHLCCDRSDEQEERHFDNAGAARPINLGLGRASAVETTLSTLVVVCIDQARGFVFPRCCRGAARARSWLFFVPLWSSLREGAAFQSCFGRRWARGEGCGWVPSQPPSGAFLLLRIEIKLIHGCKICRMPHWMEAVNLRLVLSVEPVYRSWSYWSTATKLPHLILNFMFNFILILIVN